MTRFLRTFVVAFVAAFFLIPLALGAYGWITGEAEFFVVVHAFFTYLVRITLVGAMGVAIIALIVRSGWMLASRLWKRQCSINSEISN